MTDKIEAYNSFFNNTVNDTDPELFLIIQDLYRLLYYY